VVRAGRAGRAGRRVALRWVATGRVLVALGLQLATAAAQAAPARQAAGATPAAPGAAPRFTDITVEAGIDFVYENGAAGEKLLPETMGGGCAFLDHDQDGDADVLLVGSSRWPWDTAAAAGTAAVGGGARAGEPDDPARAGGAASSLALYVNDGQARFADATAAAGLQRVLYAMGPAVGDIEGDGDDDLYITAVGPNVLYRNAGGQFSDVTSACGVAGGADDWSTAAGFFDADGDGDLDLLVAHYVRWSRELDLAADRRLDGIPGRAYLPPMAFEGSQPLFFVNRGDGVFDERASASGLHVTDEAGRPLAKALALFFVDLDDDHDSDVFVASDTTRNLCFVNDGHGQFREQARELGLAYDQYGHPTGSMGVDGGAFADDERLALFVGNFAGEMSSAYVGPRRDPYFSDETMALGLGPATRAALTFGLLSFDADLDGAPELLQVNGHLEPGIDSAPGGQTYAQRSQLFRQRRDDGVLRYEELPASALGDLGRPLPGRGAATADIDADGDLDLLLTQVAGRPWLLRNDCPRDPSSARALRLVLQGRPGSPTALGAEVFVRAGGRTQRRRVDPTRSYLSQSERALTFGLGAATEVESIAVRWPDGSESAHAPPALTGALTVLNLVQPVSPEQVQHTLHVAKAQLESGRLGPARATLAAAVQLAPQSAPTWRNLARAQLAANEPAAALAALERAAALEPGDVGTLYLRAMALLRAGQPQDALPLLDAVVRADPHTAAARFQLARALTELERGAEALVQLEETVRLDPAHGPAFFQIAAARRKAGDLEGFRAANLEFLRLRQLYGEAYATPLSLEACRYTLAEAALVGGLADGDGGAQAADDVVRPAADDVARPEAGPAGGPEVPAGPPRPALGAVRFQDASEAWFGGARPAAAMAVLSMDEQGRYALLVARPDGVLERLDRGADGRFVPTEVASGLGDLAQLSGLIVGNVLDEPGVKLQAGSLPARHADAFLLGESTALLLQQQADGSFRDVSERAGLEGAVGRRALWVDHEHDGDLDLAVAGAQGLSVLVNTNDGSFEPSTALPDVGGPAHDLLALDFDDNGAVDFAVAVGTPDAAGAATGAGDRTVRIDNRRAGRFALPPDPPGPWPAAVRLLGDDLDGDGRPDVALVEEHGVRFVFDGVPGPLQAVDGLSITCAALVDPDGDGRLDLLLGGAREATGAQIEEPAAGGRLALLAHGGRGPWRDASAEVGLEALAWQDVAPVADVLAADLDGDGDSDLLVRTADDRLLALSTVGGEQGGLLKLRLLALMSPSGGLGARVEVRQGAFFASRTIQAEQPIEIGLGGRRQLDSVLALWPYGVLDTRTDVVAGGAPVAIVVLEKADTGSCPFLYVWDGERMRFINDMVGSGATDLPLSREQLNPVNPHEIIGVGPAADFPLVDGSYQVSITSELREAAYYDEAALIVVDHPPGTELASSDRLRPPPFPPSEVLLLADGPELRSAVGSDGLDRTAALAALDGMHAPPGEILPPPLRGVCRPLVLELDFGPLGEGDAAGHGTPTGPGGRWSAADPAPPALVLALSGYIEFGTASTMIALSQRSDVPMQWPLLEARGGDGAWHELPVVVGLPGGKRRDLTVPLAGLLPPGCDRLRLTTTFELHWDRVALRRRLPLPAEALHEIRPASAELRWRGFSELLVRAPGQPRLPDYDVVSQTPPWRVVLSGWCTAYGDVLPLLLAEDGRLVVLNSGDELRLRLPAADLPPVPAGMQRTLLWRSVGYNKEADPNNAGAGSIWPLGPDTRYGKSDEEEDAWRLRYNTRFVPPDRFQPRASGAR